MKRLLWLVALVAGCDRVWGLERGATSDAFECFGRSNGKGLLQVCTDKILEEEYVLPQDVDTDDVPPPPCTEIVTQGDTDHTEVCVIAADRIRVQGAPVLHGGRSVVLVARHRLIIDPGTVVDVATHRGAVKRDGAGAPKQICVVNSGAGTNVGGGGGAGGGFQGPSARGGNAMQADGGAAPGAVPIQGVRAGCRGGDGGNGSMSGGSGGVGGGALYLIAGDRIEVAGVINASGEGGAGGAKPGGTGGGGGGGGGGSGGLIGIDAPLVTIALGAVLVANGGGGGGGGSPGGASTMGGSDGTDPVVFGGTFPFDAVGGAGGAGLTAPGGMGGHGAAGDTPPTNGGGSIGGGGGGGGAAGYILVYGATIDDTDAVFSPPRGP